MCSINKSYEAFARLLNHGDAHILGQCDFHKICRMLHTSETSLEEILLEELGMTGQDIMDEYFGNAV